MKFPLRSITLAICATALGTGLQLQAGTVTNTTDSGPGSLRDTIAAATNGDTIDFAPALNGATITLTSGSILIVTKQLTIDALTLDLGIQISGNNSSRILTIITNSNVTLKKLTLRNGRQISGSSEIQPENGGALFASGGQLTMSDCVIKNSLASANGGGAYFGNGIQANINRCSIVGNEGSAFGGGVHLAGTSSFSMTNSLISGNHSAAGGGGIFNLIDNPVFTNCTISGNSGAGIRNENFSAPILRNSIVWGNIFSTGTLAAQQIYNNAASTAADVNYCLIEGASSSASFSDGNRVLWGSNNMDGSTANPQFLAPIVASATPNSGGDYRVFTNSPVLDIGNNAANSTSHDRAGKARIQNTTIDLGAFESGYVTFAFLHPSLSPSGDENTNGLSNYLEYAIGIDPSAPDDPSARPTLTSIDGVNLLTTSQRSNAADTHPFWETSTSLEFLSWSKMVQGVNYLIESTSIPSPDRQQLVLELLDTDPSRVYSQAFSTN